MMNRKILTTYLALAAAVLFWSLSYIWAKVALISFSVVALVAVRYAVAASVVLAVFSIRGFPKFERRDLAKIVLTALFFPFLYYVLETTALKFTTASEAGVIAAMLPIFAAVFSALFLKERTTWAGTVGILGSVFGIFLLITGGIGRSPGISGNLGGNLMMLGAMVAAAAYMVVLKTLEGQYRSFDVTGVQLLIGTVFILLYALIRSRQFHAIWTDLPALGSLLCLAILSTIVATLGYNIAIARMPVTRVSIVINLVPIVTAVAARIVLEDHLNAVQIVGGVIVIAAVSVANLFGGRRAAE